MSLSISSTICKVLFCVVVFVWAVDYHVSAVDVSHDGRAITIDGHRRILLSGSIHYPRSTPQMWGDLIQKAKEGGLNAIETYVFWNAHEPRRRQYDFSDNLDLVRFVKTIHNVGLYAVLRIGPYVCAEWNYGGFPVWLHNMPNIELRTANNVFMNEMQNFTTLIVNMIKQNKLFASQGGPIIIAQIENEYGNEIKQYGEAGKEYLKWSARMANSLNIGVPWIMCQQQDAPPPMINTCNGWYCDNFTPNNASSPKMWTENWTGWFKSWGDKDPHRTAEDLAFSVARFFQTGGTFQNYYMYHGGTNFGRTAGGPYITTSYDYDAPLDEYGNLNQPKWGHLKQLHVILRSMETTLTHGNVSTIDFNNSVTATMYETKETSGCFLSNANTTVDATIFFQGKLFTVPAWSVTILPDCAHEAFNTAKVNTQTSIMVRKSSNDSERRPSSWSWRPERIDDMVVLGKGDIGAQHLMDQKDVATDQSDYLWYMTSVDVKEDNPVWSDDITLWANATGQVIHAFVNGQHVGLQYSKYGVTQSVLEAKVKLDKGKRNMITLLSATVGFQNYGARYDLIGNGVLGPVQLIGQKGKDEEVVMDISNHKWRYKVGLHGYDNRIYHLDSHFPSKWVPQDLPINKIMTWYKASFKAPSGEDPVVVDMQGLGKGEAWINGHSIGRYWPSYLASEDGCGDQVCDYRGSYTNSKCLTNCGNPTQRWYHVPRSFLKDDDVNTLVLFEEFGGDPSLVNLETVSIGRACVNGYENNTLEVSCQGRPISAINFANYGNPQGTCASFKKGTCEEERDVMSIVKEMCVGKMSCSIDVSEATLGSTNCGGHLAKRLAVEAVC